jgi:hypothetical protein
MSPLPKAPVLVAGPTAWHIRRGGIPQPSNWSAAHVTHVISSAHTREDNWHRALRHLAGKNQSRKHEKKPRLVTDPNPFQTQVCYDMCVAHMPAVHTGATRATYPLIASHSRIGPVSHRPCTCRIVESAGRSGARAVASSDNVLRKATTSDCTVH